MTLEEIYCENFSKEDEKLRDFLFDLFSKKETPVSLTCLVLSNLLIDLLPFFEQTKLKCMSGVLNNPDTYIACKEEDKRTQKSIEEHKKNMEALGLSLCIFRETLLRSYVVINGNNKDSKIH